MTDHTYGLVGQSAGLSSVRRLIEKASASRLPVLVLGETGTGKEVVARAIHNANPQGRFVPIDCGSLVGSLMESELFGHLKGSFSGAMANKQGLVELADGGTAFFDEIGDLPLDMQVKLLRLFQECEYRPVGSVLWHKVNFRIIAATHRDLRQEVEAGRFRRDLFYRINVFNVRVPPLRERREDIPLLVEKFLKDSGSRIRLTPEILRAIESQDWPGNVRELKHCIERLLALYPHSLPQLADLQSEILLHEPSEQVPSLDTPCVQDAPAGNTPSLAESERRVIRSALDEASGHVGRAAQILGIGRTTLYRKMKLQSGKTRKNAEREGSAECPLLCG